MIDAIQWPAMAKYVLKQILDDIKGYSGSNAGTQLKLSIFLS
jgi:hypothetical protein